ncbi:MAG: hypothetical protein MUO76_12705, partial [Anaerolineaceae bacterium]|nr:hypothetical protein [Anaerolineaceae bacterium]
MKLKSSFSSGLDGTRWSGLTLQLFLLIVLPVTVLLVLIAVGSTSLHQQAMRDLVVERNERIVKTTALAVDTKINSLLSSIHMLAQISVLEGYAPEEFITASHALLPDFDGALGAYTSEGEWITSIGETGFWQREGISACLAEILIAQDQQTGNVRFCPQSELSGSVLLASSAVVEHSPLVVGAFDPVEVVGELLKAVGLADGTFSVLLIDSSRNIIYQSMDA